VQRSMEKRPLHFFETGYYLESQQQRRKKRRLLLRWKEEEEEGEVRVSETSIECERVC
jgi:hypothetical protein